MRHQLSSQMIVAVTTPVPSEAIGLIQEFEGCERFEPVDGLIHTSRDPHTGDEPHSIDRGTIIQPDGRKVKFGHTIIRKDADHVFTTTLQERYWEPISKTIPHWDEMNDPLRSALCSFA